MSTEYCDYVLSADGEIIREIQEFCAEIHAEQKARDEKYGKVDGRAWTYEQAVKIADMLNRSKNPVALFRFMDERTGSSHVGYSTRDGREWFHILRQMRNTRGSGLLENLGRAA